MIVDHYSVFINAGAVVLLPVSMVEQERLDVLNSVLLAQLVANRKYPAFSHTGEWYDAYREVLKDGWLQKAVAWGGFTLDAGSKCNMVDWVGSRLGEFVDRTIVTEVTGVLNRVAQLPCTLPAIELLRKHVQRQKDPGPSETTVETGCKISLQVILAQQGPVLSRVYVEVETTEQVISNPLGQFFSSDTVLGNIQLRCFQANLSNALYEPLRDAIVKKLGDKAAKNILGVSDAIEHELPTGAPL